MPTCRECSRSGLLLELKDGLCPFCRKGIEEAEAKKRDALVALSQDLDLTTETFVGDVERLGIVATEVVLGMNIFRDILANVRDLVGGRSGAVQDTLDEARQAAFDDLRLKAAEMGANGVIAVAISYHSISTGSAVNMMIVAVSGTAVRYKKD